MTNYHLKPLTTLSSLEARQAKEQRKKLLDEVRARRKLNYQRFKEKMEHSPTQDFTQA